MPDKSFDRPSNDAIYVQWGKFKIGGFGKTAIFAIPATILLFGRFFGVW